MIALILLASSAIQAADGDPVTADIHAARMKDGVLWMGFFHAPTRTFTVIPDTGKNGSAPRTLTLAQDIPVERLDPQPEAQDPRTLLTKARALQAFSDRIAALAKAAKNPELAEDFMQDSLRLKALAEEAAQAATVPVDGRPTPRSATPSAGVRPAYAGMFGQRTADGRSRSVGANGGTLASEAAVEAGLRWLKRHQGADGSWDPVAYPNACQESPKCEPGEMSSGAREALTGYALLCFLGAGYDHRSENPYRTTVREGIKALLAMQTPDGVFGKRNYEHPIAAMAVIEAYGMTRDPMLKEPSQKAIKVILDRQAKDPKAPARANAGLGWDYVAPKPERIDGSVSGWNVLCLKSAAGAGFKEAKGGLDGAKRYLTRAWADCNARDRMPKDASGTSTFPYTWDATTGRHNVSYGSTRNQDLAGVGLAMAAAVGCTPVTSWSKPWPTTP